ncbi:hypothetical protein BGW42_004093 [Actinomortierella wolfii]|nr:hypothetical protein BGW42_004093 [Actinomortierella wolfii]
MTSTREKIEESFALLNSLWVATQDASSANRAPCLANGQAPTGTLATHHPGRGNISINPTTSETLSANKRIFPPVQRAPVLDKLAKLTAKRSSLQDSIAASITASTSISKRAFSQSEPTRSRLPSTSPSSSTSTERAKQIRFRPWSREQFHERLSTFKPSTWFDKPQLVNPVECAKYGWINKGDDRLECSGGCGGVAIMRGGVERLPKTTSAPIAEDTESSSPTHEEPHDESLMATEEEDMDDFDFDTEALGPKFHDLLTSCHAKSCPWKNHPCDDNIYKFPVLSRTQAKDEYLDRLTGLELMKDDPLIAKVHHPLVLID